MKRMRTEMLLELVISSHWGLLGELLQEDGGFSLPHCPCLFIISVMSKLELVMALIRSHGFSLCNFSASSANCFLISPEFSNSNIQKKEFTSSGSLSQVCAGMMSCWSNHGWVPLGQVPLLVQLSVTGDTSTHHQCTAVPSAGAGMRSAPKVTCLVYYVHNIMLCVKV